MSECFEYFIFFGNKIKQKKKINTKGSEVDFSLIFRDQQCLC